MEIYIQTYSPLPEGKPLESRSIQTEVTTCRIATAIDAGFAGASISFREYIGSQTGSRLVEPLNITDLAHVQIFTDVDRGFLLYEGRVQDFDQIGGQQCTAFTCEGYGTDALKDDFFRGGVANEPPLSGRQLLERVVNVCAPLLHFGDADSFPDPGGSYPPAEQNGKYAGQAFDQVLKAGTDNNSQLIYTVYEDRMISIQPRVPPLDAKGFVTWDYEAILDRNYFTWKRSGAQLINGCAVEYTPLAGQPAVTDINDNPTVDWIGQYGLHRRLYVPNSTMVKSQAELLRDSFLNRYSVPIVTGVTVCDARHYLLDRLGSPVPFWRPRSGEWIKIPGWEPMGELQPLLITGTDCDLQKGTCQLTCTNSDK